MHTRKFANKLLVLKSYPAVYNSAFHVSVDHTAGYQ